MGKRQSRKKKEEEKHVSKIPYLLRCCSYRVHSIVDSISCALSRRRLAPFACICIAVGHAATYASTSTSLPNVLWSGKNSMKLDGKDITWSTLRTSIADEIKQLERFILEDVLFGIPLDRLGFNIDEATKIQDRLDDTTVEYSMFSDPGNPFRSMTHNLANALFGHPAAAHMHKGVHIDEHGRRRVSWDDKGTSDWLLVCERATRRLLLIMHIVGGQLGRGVEMCLINAENALYRVRNVYCIAPGQIIYVLFYNKTTSGTQHDRPIAHAIPWKVGRLFLIMHALVKPLSSLLTQHVVRSRDARSLHQQAGFASFGRRVTSEQLGNEIETWFLRHHNANVRIRLLRHLIIACQRHFMPEAFSPMEKALRIVDAQAGHSTETAESHYAIEASEITLLSVDTVLKYILASARWCLVLLEGLDVLTDVEMAFGKAAPNLLKQQEDYPHVGRSRIVLTAEEVQSLGLLLVKDGQVAHGVVDLFMEQSDRFAAKVVDGLFDKLASLKLTSSELTPSVHPQQDSSDSNAMIISPTQTLRRVFSSPPLLRLPEGSMSSSNAHPTTAQIEFATRFLNTPPSRLIVEPKHLELLL